MAKKIGKFTAEELQVIASIQEERNTTRKSALRYFQRNRDKYMLRGTKAAVAPAVVDVKQRAANDTPEPVAEKKPKAPKTTPVKLTAEEVSANRAEGLRLYKLAGRPKKEQFITLFGKDGVKWTWDRRAKELGLSSAEECAAQFPRLLAKAVGR